MGHLDKRTVEARALEELKELYSKQVPGVAGLGVRLKIARLKAGISLLTLAWDMRGAGFKWNQKRAWMVERGDSVVRVDELHALGGLLDCDPVWLMYGLSDVT